MPSLSRPVTDTAPGICWGTCFTSVNCVWLAVRRVIYVGRFVDHLDSVLLVRSGAMRLCQSRTANRATRTPFVDRSRVPPKRLTWICFQPQHEDTRTRVLPYHYRGFTYNLPISDLSFVYAETIMPLTMGQKERNNICADIHGTPEEKSLNQALD